MSRDEEKAEGNEAQSISSDDDGVDGSDDDWTDSEPEKTGEDSLDTAAAAKKPKGSKKWLPVCDRVSAH